MRGYDVTKKRVPFLSAPYATALLNDFPTEIKKAVRVNLSHNLISFNNSSFNEKQVYLADADFFNFFSFPLLRGNASTVLKEPSSVVLTKTTAKKYFGSIDNAIGKVVEMDKHRQLKVTGVAEDVPSNSHMDFDLVIPLSNYANEPWFTSWKSNNNSTYVLLGDHVSKAQVEKRFPEFINKYLGKDLARTGDHLDLALTPLSDIYLESASEFDNVKHGDKTVVYIFLSVAALILLIACINFMNLSTIRAVERSKEVGLRKVMGALRNHLVWQFIGESMLLTLIACIFSLALMQVLMPFYNQLLGYTLTVSWNALPLYLFLPGVVIIVGFLAGSYPAFVLSVFSPIESLKGKLRLGKGGSLFRQGLVVFQFSVSVFLIIGTIIIMNQMNYVKNKHLGYDKEQTVVVMIDNKEFSDNKQVFKNDLQGMNNVTSVSFMSGEPGGFFDMGNFEAEGQTNRFLSRTEFTDFEFVKTLGLKIIAGRDFSPQFGTDTTGAVLINRTAAASLGFTPQQAIGKWIKNTDRDSSRRSIIGVVEDFHFLSLKENMDPLVIAPGTGRRLAVIKLKPGNIQSSLATLKNAYSKVAPVYPFEYSFLDEKFDQLYKEDIRQQKILGVFSAVAIFIACLGLFGLASFSAARRTKEIGVRKVLGSSMQNIVLLISKDLLRPVLIATLIAMPAGYYAMNNWLQNFAYRTPLHWWVFVLAAAITFCIALVTVGFKAVKAAGANPVKSLRTE
jgi:putative ABC transport system permease protein